jgi:raffinose/stachyose/melibiose transport system permease protein
VVQPQKVKKANASPSSGNSQKRGVRLSRRATTLFVLPAILVFGVFVLYPMIMAFSYAFFEWHGTARGGFSGFANFFTLFNREPYRTDVPRAFMHNLLIFGVAMVIQNTLGMALAYAIFHLRRGKRFFQVLYTLPYLVSSIVIGYLWSLMLSSTFGPVNKFLEVIGLRRFALPWLGDPKTAIWVLILVVVWQWIGFPVLLYGAALGGVPVDLDDAASIDGANRRQRFFSVTLPLIMPSVTTVSVLGFIGAMEAFALPYALGGSTGSPAGSTDVLSLVFYRVAFESGDSNGTGMSSALATLLFLFIFGVAVITTGFMRRREEMLT